jgi:nucleoside-diphosphate-sugar epimerase
MRVLLAGASGAIGRYLLPQLIEAKHDVIGITRTPGSLASTGAEELVADVLDRSAFLEALEGVEADAVIHQLTSLRKPPSRLRDMRDTNRLRAEGTSTLIAAARLVGATKFVAGSFFGGYGLIDHGREPLTEESPFGDLDGRADAVQRALLSLEQQVHAFGGVSLRFGLFYDSTSVSVSPVSRSWDGRLPMLHVSDAATATVLALEKYRPRAVYNIADGHPLSYRAREIARAKSAALSAPLRLPDGLLRIVAPYGSLLLTRTSMDVSSALAETELGWTPRHPSLLETLGQHAPASEHVARAFAMPLPVPELVEGPEPFPVPELVEGSESLPVVELVEEPEAFPVPELVDEPEPELSPEPEPVSDPVPEVAVKTNPRPRSSAPRKPRIARPPKDPFSGMDDAIARIGNAHED